MAWSPPVAPLTFDKFNKIIYVDAPETEVTIQDLINQIRDWEDELTNMDYSHVANAYGKQALGGGEFVGITLELRDGWRLAFEARPSPDTILMTVRGGNLVALDVNGNVQNPIFPTAFTQVVIAQSTSPSIKTPESDVNLLHMVEYLTGTHKSIGGVYYWDPVNGDDANDGTQPDTAVQTFSRAHELCTDGNQDIIFALAKSAAGPITVNENLTITKDAIKLRGPGYPFQIIPTTPGTDTITINAQTVEISGFYIGTAPGGGDNAITIAGDNNLIKDCWIASADGNGINVSSSARTQIQTCAIEDSGQGGTGNGINIGASSSRTVISKSIITGSAEDGVNIAGSSVSDNIFENNLIYNNSGYGIDIGSGVLRTGVRFHHTFSGNTLGATNDNGSQTFIETQAGGASATEIADAVWDELIADHVTAGTTGKTLRDAKTKATLASLK